MKAFRSIQTEKGKLYSAIYGGITVKIYTENEDWILEVYAKFWFFTIGPRKFNISNLIKK